MKKKNRSALTIRLDTATALAHQEMKNGEYKEFDNLSDLLTDLHNED